MRFQRRWNDTDAEFPRDLCLHQLFEQQAARLPDAMAVMFEGASLTYAQLDRRATRVAHQLKRCGVGPGSLVGLCLNRSPGLIVGILGILKAGAAYVPLDPVHPSVRLEMILQDAGVSIILTEDSLTPRLPEKSAIHVLLERLEGMAMDAGPGDEGGPVGTPEGRAYAMFTSGSTGRPKGVPIRHRSVVSLITAFQRLLPMEPGMRFLGVASPGFDISVLEYFLPLSQGATTVLVSADTSRDADALMETMRHVAPRYMQATPSTWGILLECGWRGDREMAVVSAGEALHGALRTRLAGSCREVWDVYGPTETTVYSTVQRVSDDLPGPAVSCIGRPIANTRVYLLDSSRKPVPDGAVGELFIGGVGVSEGYLNRPDLTAERFIPDPFTGVPGAHLYRTGDQCRWRPDGTLEYLGRLDHQVKLRGFRIELGEIEAALREHPSVSEAVVLLREDRAGDPRLVGYVVAVAGQHPDTGILRSHLSGRVPSYMVPTVILLMPAMPLSVSGKLHRAALPAPGGYLPESASPSTISDTPTEAAVAGLRSIWEQEPGERRIGNLTPSSGASVSPVVAPRPVAGNLMDLLEEDSETRQKETAIEWAQESLTHEELRQRYDRLASVLRGRGVGPGVVVALCVDRSADRIIGVLGILKSGGACLPVDPKYPPARVAAMLEDGRPDGVVCSRVHVPLFHDSGVPVLVIEDLDSQPAGPVVERCLAGPEDPVYVLFTSGSTGRAKGVVMPHRALVNLIRWQCRTSVMGTGGRTLQFAPISFDVSFQEIFSTLVPGGTLVLVSEEDRMDPAALLATIQTWRVDRLILPFVALHALVAPALRPGPFPSALKEVFSSGEALRITPEISEFFARLPGCRFCNQYGPTEGHVVTEFELTGPPASWEIMPPIGRAIDGVRLRLLDEHRNPVAAGVEGELHIGGACLALGYRNRPDLTAERFVSDVGDPADRWYRTGDRAVERADGSLVFRGRTDGQVKVRGHRIELGEVEAALERHPGIGQSVAAAVEIPPAATRLVAYYVAAGTVDDGSLRQHLAGILPEYMVPSCFLPVPSLPRTPSGKIDRQALAAMVEATTTGAQETTGSMTEDERTVASIWSEVLNHPRVGLHESFFDLGGHSLLAMKVIARLRRAWSCPLSIRALFENPTVARLAAQRPQTNGSAGPGPASPPPPAPVASASGSPSGDLESLLPRLPGLPLQASPAQERLWFLNCLEPDSTAYLVSDALRLRGPLDSRALESALREIVRRHESLRTVFEDAGGYPRPVTLPAPEIILAEEDISTLAPAEAAVHISTRLSELSSLRFDLATGPLFRFRLIRLGLDEHLFLRTFHHIISDGWSAGVFSRELTALYDAGIHQRSLSLPPLPIQYADFAGWQRRRLEGGALEALLEHWIRRLDGAPLRLELPKEGRTSHRASGPRGARSCGRKISAQVADAVHALARSTDATPFIVLLSVFKVLLCRLSGQDDIVIGTPIAGRDHVATEPLIGFFVSTIVLRTDLSGNPSFRALVGRIRETVLDAQDHQELPFEKLIERLHPDRNIHHHPVFQVLFNLLNFEDDLPVLGGVQTVREPVPLPDAKFDLTIYVIARAGRLEFKAVFPPDLFQDASVERLLGQLEGLLEHFVGDPDAPILVPSLIRPEDRGNLPQPTLPLGNPPQPSIQAPFESQVRRTPDRLAVRDVEREWTYCGLDSDANRVANHLIRSGVQPGETVAVYAVPSGALVIAILGILKAGGRFQVLDSTQPEVRLQSMFEQARPVACLQLDPAGNPPTFLGAFSRQPSTRCVISVPSGIPSDVPAESPGLRLGGGDPAYVVFTSGSTGEPLGILGDHGPVSHFLAWHRDRFGIAETDRFSLLSGAGHDPLLRDLFAPLSCGASLHIPPADVKQSYAAMQSWFDREGITVSHLTPALSQILAGSESVRGPRLERLRWVFIGGDRLTGSVVTALRLRAPGAGVVNFYGTTETPQAMAYHLVVPAGTDAAADIDITDPIPLGFPIPDAQWLLINPAGQPAGVGELAEIGIRTSFLSRSYLGNPAMTRERYRSNPFSGMEVDRIYRTGDLGRHLPDGSVVYVGRRDGQIKVRGYRIEPDEVRAALRRHPAVREGFVTATADGEDGLRIRAYLLLRNPLSPPSRTELKSMLKATLPEAAIPSEFIVVPVLPLTANGKVDTRALARMAGAGLSDESRESEPRNEAEAQMLVVWREVLKRPSAGIHDDFFDLGGHSLLALRLVTTLHRRLDLPLALADLFAFPTVAGLAGRMNEETRGIAGPDSFRGTGSGVPWFHIPGVFGFEFLSPTLAALIGHHRRYHDGLQYPGVDGRRPPATSVKAIAGDLARQIVAVCPSGPVWLSGYSMGGTVAIEVARQLTAAGREVERIVLFDTRMLRGARRTALGERFRTLMGRYRELPKARRWPWIRGLVRTKVVQFSRRFGRRLGLGGRTLHRRMEKAGWAASAAHLPEPHVGAVTLFRSTRLGQYDSAAWERDPLNGWGPYLGAEFEVRNMDCDHEHIFLEPVHPSVLAALEALLIRSR